MVSKSRKQESINSSIKKSKLLKKTSKKKNKSSSNLFNSSISDSKSLLNDSIINYSNNSVDNIKKVNENAMKLIQMSSDKETKSSFSDKTSKRFYPSITDSKFNQEIINHPIFKRYVYPDSKVMFKKLYDTFSNNRDIKEDEKVEMDKIFKLTPSQKFLRNFMSPYTPYRGLFVIHGTGVGKTCTGLTIAEQLKDYVKDNNQKITIIRSDEFKREAFEMSTLKTEDYQNQCTGDTYLQDEFIQSKLEGCNSKNDELCDLVRNKITKKIKSYYDFTTPRAWVNSLVKVLNRRVGTLKGEEKEQKIRQTIQKIFNNGVLIIDEAHNLRDGDTSEKIIPPYLKLVLKHSHNLRLILLSATPMFDKPQNIISLLNYLIYNDNRPPLDEKKIFEKDGKLKPSGQKILSDAMKGYISYMRGNNPFEFPIRITARENIPTKILNLKKYPTHNIQGNEKINDQINYLDIVDCKFGKNQQSIFDQYIKTDINNSKNSKDDVMYDKSDFDPSVAFSNELQISNFIYQSLEEANGNRLLCYGDKGLEQVATKLAGKMTYRFKDPDYYKRFQLPELRKWGTKVASIVENVQKCKGPVFIYASFTASGVIPLAFALEMAGYRRYKQHSVPLLEDKHKDSNYKGDYIVYTGNERLSTHAKKFFDLRKAMIKEDKVKIVIGSRKASEGLNLYGFREVHILDPWHNMSVLEQSIGRAIRRGSHNHLLPQERNVSVYLYASTLNDNRESIDLKIYRISENKAINTGVVENLLKQTAIDCYFTLNINKQDPKVFNKKIPIITSIGKKTLVDLSDQPYTKNCLYMKQCDYKCANINKDKIGIKSKFDKVPVMFYNIEKDVQEYQRIITNLLANQLNLNIDHLATYLKLDNEEDKKIFFTVLQNLINTGVKFKNKKGETGKVMLVNNFIRFIPLDNQTSDISIQLQHYDKDLYFDLRKKENVQYINLSKSIKLLKNKKHINLEYQLENYSEILLNLFNTVISKLGNATNKSSNLELNESILLDLHFDKINYKDKKIIITNILTKYNINSELSYEEEKLLPLINKYCISYSDIFTSDSSNKLKVYGFIVMNFDKLTFLYFDEDQLKFLQDNGLLKKVIKVKNNQLNNKGNNKLFGYLNYKDKYKEADYKITDLIQKGDKKSVKGFKCLNGQSQDVIKYIKMIQPKYFNKVSINKNKNVLCNDLEILMKMKDAENNKKFFYTPEEYFIKEYSN